MNLLFSQNGWEDYLYWQKIDKSIEKSLVKKINQLITATLRDPFKGIGKPEPLKFEYSGYWSRRIDREHRLVYCVEDNVLHIAACRYYYTR